MGGWAGGERTHNNNMYSDSNNSDNNSIDNNNIDNNNHNHNKHNTTHHHQQRRGLVSRIQHNTRFLPRLSFGHCHFKRVQNTGELAVELSRTNGGIRG